MNNFTKEDLETFHCGIGWIIDQGAYHELEPLIELRNRLKSMIDNYCERECDHRSNGNYYKHDGSYSSYPTDIYRCKYCDKLYKCIFQNGMCIGYEDFNDN